MNPPSVIAVFYDLASQTVLRSLRLDGVTSQDELSKRRKPGEGVVFVGPANVGKVREIVARLGIKHR